MKKISIIGITGSIGTQTLKVIDNNLDKFVIEAFSIGYDSDFEIAMQLINKYSPSIVSCIEEITAKKLEIIFPNTKFTFGEESLCDIAKSNCDIFVNSVVGSVGLIPTIVAIEHKKTIALANKETLVIAGEIIMSKAREFGVDIIPIDSEHSAIFQCLNGEDNSSIKNIILTASGGSFRNLSREELKDVTIDQALNHPNWKMGKKITIDSATMMNKGLEIIEAYYLFNVNIDQIKVLIHYESIIHSMIEFVDNSFIAQLGTSDMYLPISYALSYPIRLEGRKERLDLAKIGTLNFKSLDFKRYPCVKYAYDAIKIGHTMPAVLNASNEIAVDAFLNNKISFIQIEEIIEKMMCNHKIISNPSLSDILEIDKKIRHETEEMIRCL